jgi:hypothetical protein
MMTPFYKESIVVPGFVEAAIFQCLVSPCLETRKAALFTIEE